MKIPLKTKTVFGGKINGIKLCGVIFIFIAALFIIISLCIFVPQIAENGRRQEIAETGKAGVGYNLNLHASGNTINNVEYYYVTFKYVGDGGVELEGKTSSTYTYVQASNIVFSRTLDIIYNENGAVESGYDKVAANKLPKIMLLVFCGLGVVFIGVGGSFMFKSDKNQATVMKNGVVTKGVISDIKSVVRVNGVEYYRIYISFTNQRGETVTGRTGDDYTAESAYRYSSGQSVSIKYYGKSVVILNDDKV